MDDVGGQLPGCVRAAADDLRKTDLPGVGDTSLKSPNVRPS